MNLSIISDEISRDFMTATEILGDWGIKYVELRDLRTGRVPEIDEREEKEILHCLECSGIKVSAISPGICKYPLNIPNVEQHTKSLLIRSIKFAEQVRTKNIIIFGFRKPRGTPNNIPLPAQGVTILRDVVDYVDEHEMQTLLENHSGCYVNTSNSLYECVKRVGMPSLRINWDPNNSFLASKTSYQNEYDFLKGLVANVHIKDTKIVNGRFIRVPIGEGSVGWNDILKALINERYEGFYTLETHYEPRIANIRVDMDRFCHLYSVLVRKGCS